MNKYERMIQSFAADFEIAMEEEGFLSSLEEELINGNENLKKDIILLSELAMKIRSGQIEIVESNLKKEIKNE